MSFRVMLSGIGQLSPMPSENFVDSADRQAPRQKHPRLEQSRDALGVPELPQQSVMTLLPNVGPVCLVEGVAKLRLLPHETTMCVYWVAHSHSIDDIPRKTWNCVYNAMEP